LNSHRGLVTIGSGQGDHHILVHAWGSSKTAVTGASSWHRYSCGYLRSLKTPGSSVATLRTECLVVLGLLVGFGLRSCSLEAVVGGSSVGTAAPNGGPKRNPRRFRRRGGSSEEDPSGRILRRSFLVVALEEDKYSYGGPSNKLRGGGGGCDGSFGREGAFGGGYFRRCGGSFVAGPSGGVSTSYSGNPVILWRGGGAAGSSGSGGGSFGGGSGVSFVGEEDPSGGGVAALTGAQANNFGGSGGGR
ncbi:keratin, type I cytoskeletal 9-like, partial [Penaeus monodon]|uniref:keratin, type I cytoskeletal 9-like n=1 Tax=Penaeus monodon TaxID=6687 RepID=UPI0018A75A7C